MKQRLLALLDRLPLLHVTVIGLLLGLSPFVPEPHLIEKLRMLAHGTLTRPLDIFDLFLHAIPLLLLVLKLWRMLWLRQQQSGVQ